MYVCICNRVTESDIHAEVERGVRSMRQLMARTNCSRTCGRCARTATEVLNEALGDDKGFLSVVRTDHAA